MTITFSVLAQLILGYILGLILPYYIGIGNGFEWLTIPVGTALGVWLGGMLVAKIGHELPGWGGWQFLGALVGAAVGFAIINFVVLGFFGILIPIGLAIIGYWAGGRTNRR